MLDPMKQLPVVYRNDPWLKALFRGACKLGAQAEADISQLYNDLFADTMSARQAAIEETSCGLTENNTLDLATRRARIEARWKTGGSCTLELLQDICDTWQSNVALVTLEDNVIVISVNMSTKTTKSLTALLVAIETAKPAHLSFELRQIAEAQVYSAAYMTTIDTMEVRI